MTDLNTARTYTSACIMSDAYIYVFGGHTKIPRNISDTHTNLFLF